MAVFAPAFRLESLLYEFCDITGRDGLGEADPADIITGFRSVWQNTIEAGCGFYCREIVRTGGESIWVAYEPVDSPLGGLNVLGVFASIEEVEPYFRSEGYVFAARSDGQPPVSASPEFEFPFGLGDGHTDEEILALVREFADGIRKPPS